MVSEIKKTIRMIIKHNEIITKEDLLEEIQIFHRLSIEDLEFFLKVLIYNGLTNYSGWLYPRVDKSEIWDILSTF